MTGMWTKDKESGKYKNRCGRCCEKLTLFDDDLEKCNECTEGCCSLDNEEVDCDRCLYEE